MFDGTEQKAAVWEVLWTSLAGSNYDLDALRSQARPDSRLTEDLGLDSLDLLEFYLRLGDRFGITVSEDDYPILTSIDAIVAFLQERVSR
jgi:acyl carrier protein